MNAAPPDEDKNTSSPKGSSEPVAPVKIAIVWAGLSMLAAQWVAPYLSTVLEGVAKAKGKPLPPEEILAATLTMQTFALTFALAWAGAKVGRSLGLGSPLLEARLAGQKPDTSGLNRAALAGILLGLAVVGLDFVFMPRMPAPVGGELPIPTPWQGFKASFYGGVAEEVMMRLGFTTLLAALATKVIGKERRSAAIVFGVVAAALLFGAGHLPLASAIWPLTSIVVARTLLLNALVGIPAGFVYARRGLEHAIVLHFSSDIVLHVIAPAVMRLVK